MSVKISDISIKGVYLKLEIQIIRLNMKSHSVKYAVLKDGKSAAGRDIVITGARQTGKTTISATQTQNIGSGLNLF
jgi:hypothetical protein